MISIDTKFVLCSVIIVAINLLVLHYRLYKISDITNELDSQISSLKKRVKDLENQLNSYKNNK